MPLAVCATPIGNLEDVTSRVLAELRAADVVLCEDTRRTAVLLRRYEIEARELLSYHGHNEAARVASIVPRLVAGERVALVSDAGLPAINDPGGRLVGEALAAGVAVTVLPGPSAVETALVVSGFSAAQYRFLGYLPRRRAELDELWRELASWRFPAVAFESPRRLGESLASLAAAAPARGVAVCRELTKMHEEVVRGTAAELASRFEGGARGEITVVIDGAGATLDAEPDLSQALAAISVLVSAGSPRKAAVDVVSDLAGLPRRALYDASLRLDG
ncbi:MAG: 16S rRNA (cytidine(1402)-2'-O)-methyltransferase [Gaiellales bacterium]